MTFLYPVTKKTLAKHQHRFLSGFDGLRPQETTYLYDGDQWWEAIEGRGSISDKSDAKTMDASVDEIIKGRGMVELAGQSDPIIETEARWEENHS